MTDAMHETLSAGSVPVRSPLPPISLTMRATDRMGLFDVDEIAVSVLLPVMAAGGMVATDTKLLLVAAMGHLEPEA